jgi:CubicO group peptidase (beta-lactamase class C family)
MRRVAFLLALSGSVLPLVALGSQVSPSAAAAGTVASPELLAKIDANAATGISATTPGCVIGIHSKNLDIVRAYGLADLERNVPITVDSVFNIASASKQFTATAVLILVKEGKLALDDDVRKFLPELPANQPRITIDELLSHTSGLRDFRFTDWMLGRDTLQQDNNDVLAYTARQKSLNHLPGDAHLYTNTGYVLLAIIVERASGRTFQDFTRERMFTPAGMTHTQWEVDSQRVIPNRAVGYALIEPAANGKPARYAEISTARDTFGHGNLLTTVGDMLRWNAALSHHLFGDKVTAQLQEPARLHNGFVLDYARGEYVGKYRGQQEVQHSGYNGNYTAWLARYPDVDLSVSTLCNSDGDGLNPRDLVDLFLPKDAPPRDARPSGTKTDLSGRDAVYRRVDTGQVALWRFPKAASMTGSKFVLGPDTYEFDAKRPADNAFNEYGNTSKWTRLPDWKPASAVLGEYQGRFTSDELLGSFDVTFDGQHLALTVLGLSKITASLEARAPDMFEAKGVDNLDGLLVVFKRGRNGAISELAITPNSLHELRFRKIEASSAGNVAPEPHSGLSTSR